MSRLTLRTRLTLIYGGLFLVAGLVLLGVTYLLLDHGLPAGPTISFESADGAPPEGEPARTKTVTELVNAEAADLRRDTLTYLLTQGGIALLVVAAAAVALGWLVAGRLLAPIGRITDTARRIAAAPAADRGLHERIKLAGPRDELRQLADTFDAMLGRLDHAFDGQRRFVANASHELRTPLALNRSLVEVAMHRPTASADVERLGEVLLDVNARQERLINGLLLLARSENELTNPVPVDLAEVVAHVTGQVGPEAAEAGVALTVTASPALVAGDPVLLERLVQNLVENGVRHNVAADGWLRVVARPGSGGARLVVTNTGPVVPAYNLPALFEPFYRGDERTSGSARRSGRGGSGAGLGLSIVQAIARAHHGDVTAVPRPGGGLVVTVTLPAPATQEGTPAGA